MGLIEAKIKKAVEEAMQPIFEKSTAGFEDKFKVFEEKLDAVIDDKISKREDMLIEKLRGMIKQEMIKNG